MRVYSVMCPPYDLTSGGIRVMYGLRSWLEIKGQVVFMNGTLTTTKDFVAIYPEIYYNNQAGADHVVRYILNEPGTMKLYGVPGPTEYDPADKIYVFSELYNKKLKVDKNHIMFLPILNLHLFKDQKKQRTKQCYFVGKGGNQNRHPQDSILIDRQFAVNQQALADLLNECHTMYAYDPVSAMYEVARLCGCRIVLMQNKYNKEDWSKYEPGMNGINWDKDEGIKVDSNAFLGHYLDMIKEFETKLENFIEDTQL